MYIIVYSDTPHSLEKEVSSLIQEGWKPQVNTSIVRNNEIKYMQAMVKDD